MKKLISCLLVLSMIASMFVVVAAEESATPQGYETCTDAEGNKLNPYFVNGVQWVEDGNGGIKMPFGHGSSLLLFDTPLTTNRVETTIVVKDNINGDGDHRNGIVCALTDDQNDGIIDYYSGIGCSYYWAFINDWGGVQIFKMGPGQTWSDFFTPSAALNT